MTEDMKMKKMVNIRGHLQSQRAEISDKDYWVTQSNLEECRTMKTAISQRHKTNYTSVIHVFVKSRL